MTDTNQPTTSLAITPGALGSLLVTCWGQCPHAAHGVLAAEHDHHIVRALINATAATPATTACTSQLDSERIHTALQRTPRSLHVAATFHAHLDAPATPTDDDLHRLTASEPIIIVSLQDIDEPDIRAWTLNGDDPRELPLRLATEPHRNSEPETQGAPAAST